MPDSVAWIPQWFAEQDGDGEFALLPAIRQLTPLPNDPLDCVFYTTKPELLLAKFNQFSTVPICVMGGAGLPTAADVSWLQELARQRPIRFLGDLDPVDTAIYAWLRAQLPLRYLGLNDRFLDVAKFSNQLQLSSTQTTSERVCFKRMVEHGIDLRGLVQPRCREILVQGRRLELEAVLNDQNSEAIQSALAV